jgi:dienelactone hydrolase
MGFEVDLPEWVFWPNDREELSIEFMRLLAAAQEGGSTFSECWRAARLIDFSDDNSWYREWQTIADTNRVRGDAAFDSGHVLTASSNWLRAVNYYLAAAFPYDLTDRKHRSAIENMRDCARKYLRHGKPAGEVVLIPWPGHYPLEGYFLPAAAGSKRAPAIICIGEPGQRKEQYLSKVARFARERGMSLLAVDLLGAGTGADFEEVAGRADLETTIGQIMDYLVERDDVDPDRIAIVADGWGSSFVARGIAFDDRFAAAVCDGGIWDLQERAFLRDRITAPDDGGLAVPIVSRVARNIKCPVLISAGERGWLKPGRLREMVDGLKAAGGDVTLKIFTSEETAAAQGHADNTTLANEFIFDWIASRPAMAAPRGGKGRN